MKVITSLAWGVTTGAAAVFLHLFLPPIGITLAVVGTATSIWAIGRRYGKRRYKVLATAAWLYIFMRAASFGTGKEIFIQGDLLGNYFLASSFLALTIALLLPAK